MNQKEVAHIWAHQSKQRARATSLYFEGDTIYSYGSHFPIARIVDDCVLFTTRDYSVTTSKHKSYVLRACSHMTVFHVQSPTEKPSQQDVEYYRNRVAETIKTASRARKYGQERLNRLESLIQEANDFCAHFNFATRFTPPENMEDLREKAIANAEREEQAQLKRQARFELQIQETIKQWLAGENVTIPYRASKTYIRAKGENLETSRGAVVPLADAHKAFRFAKLHRMSSWRRNGEQFQVGNYQLDAINENGIVAGCHRISWEEIERFAATQGW